MTKTGDKLVVDAATGETERVPLSDDDRSRRERVETEAARVETERKADAEAREAVLTALATIAGVGLDDLKRALGVGVVSKAKPGK